MGCHFLFQGIFPTEGLNPCLFVSGTGRWGFFILAPHGKHTGGRTTDKLKKQKTLKKPSLSSFSAATNITFILFKKLVNKKSKRHELGALYQQAEVYKHDNLSIEDKLT